MSRALGTRPSSSPSSRSTPSSSSRVEILCGRHAAEVLPQLAQEADEFLACGEATGNEAGLALCRVPAAEMFDDRLRVNGSVRVGRELAHRRRTAEPLG